MFRNFTAQFPQRIVFGCGAFKTIGEEIRKLGDHPFFLISKSVKLEDSFFNQFQDLTFGVEFPQGEPRLRGISELVNSMRNRQPDCIIAIGGGSVIDTAKAVGAFLTNAKEPTAYLEVVGKSAPLENDPCPIIAVPTTSGTGSEVTKNAVIGIPNERIKVSLRSERILPRIAIIDPELTISLPPEITASTGMDALTQLIEPLVSKKSNSLTDIFCIEGIRHVACSLGNAAERALGIEDRISMSYASLLGGLALANAGLGAVHGLAAVIGGMYDIPHGFICARLLPEVLAENLLAVQKMESQEFLLGKFKQISKILTGKNQAQGCDGIDWIHEKIDELRIPRLGEMGVNRAELLTIVDKAQRSSSMKANPVELPDEALLTILEKSY